MTPVDYIQPHMGWVLMHEDYWDGDNFRRDWWEAHHFSGAHKLLQVSDFRFTMTQARFEWLVDNNFPQSKTRAPWTSEEIDRMIANAESP